MSITLRTAVRTALRALAVATALLAMGTAAQAQGNGFRGGHFAHGGGPGFVHGGHFGPRYGFRGGPGLVWGGLGLGLGLGLAGYYGSPWYADRDYVVVNPPVVYGEPQPVIYPRNGQDAARIDADSNACSQWAGAQPNATVDARVFRRGIAACMDARGYTVR